MQLVKTQTWFYNTYIPGKNNGQNELKLAKEEIESLKGQLEQIQLTTQSTASHTTKPNLDESQSEAMSVSSVSKAEETNRMADIESSFEER